MPKGTCAVTGASGFLGHHIANKMKESGWSVIKLQRKKATSSETGDDIRYFSMGDKIDPKTLEGVNLLIHCAYDFSCKDWEDVERINVKGTELLFDSAQEANVGQILFISSMHAFEGCQTMYGRAKLAGEKYAFSKDGIAIRPGTLYLEEDDKVYGGQGGGTLQFFEKLFRITPVIPILYSKKPIIYTSHLRDVLDLMVEAISKGKIINKPICAVNSTPLTMKQFLMKLKDRHTGKKIWFMPVPWRIPWSLLIFLEKIKFKLPFRSESILTFFDQNPDPDFGIFEHLKTKIRAF